MPQSAPRISFIGFGEAAQAIVTGLQKEGFAGSIHAFDIKTDGPDAQKKRAEYERFQTLGFDTTGSACHSRDVIFSLVTADQAEVAALAASKTDLGNALFLDCNSCAPETKKRIAKTVEASGGRYVDVAIMTPIHPRLHKSPCLLAGAAANAALEVFNTLGMTANVASGDVGGASVRKMIRSVMIKGLEALTLECFLAAQKAGIEEETLASLNASFEDFDWSKRAPYLMERAMTHGTRRAAEMMEAAQTLEDLDIDPLVTRGTIDRHRQIGALQLDAKSIGADNLSALAKAINSRLNKTRQS